MSEPSQVEKLSKAPKRSWTVLKTILKTFCTIYDAVYLIQWPVCLQLTYFDLQHLFKANLCS